MSEVSDYWKPALRKAQQLADELGLRLGEFTWQPIGTAPKNGTNVLVSILVPVWDRPIVLVGCCNGKRWFDYAGDEIATPTHWMPLPAPPEA